MTAAGRFVVRSVSFATYGILTAGMFALLISDLSLARGAGWILLLFLADRLWHIGSADRSLARLARHGVINSARYLTPAAYHVLERAFEHAVFTGGDVVLHVLDQLIVRKEMQKVFVRMDVDIEAFAIKVSDARERKKGAPHSKADAYNEVEQLAQASFRHARIANAGVIEPKDLLTALSEVGNKEIARLFSLFGIDEGDLANAMLFRKAAGLLWRLRRAPSTLTGFLGRPYTVRHRVMNRAWTARPTSLLDQYSEDLTDFARRERVGFLIGHEEEYDRLLDVLSRPGNQNALLVGESGAGKETIIAHLAYEIVKDRVPMLFDRRLVKLDISALVAGAKENEVQERVQRIVDEMMRAGNVILYIPDIHNLTKTSGAAYLSAADALLPVIKGGALPVIGATYPQEFKAILEPNTELTNAFEVIPIQEVTESEAVRYLVYISIILERRYGMTISFGALKEAVRLAHAYFTDRPLPGSAEALLKEAVADAHEKRITMLTADEIIAIAERKVNVPIHKATAAEAARLLNLEDEIHKRLVDQEEAVREVAQALREYRSGLARQGGPIASFLFVGPTGVGKTELSKILAGIQFGSREAMARFDMSEYQDKSSVTRLLDNVTEAIRRMPYSLVLLDEFEKAHPDILNLFLQVFDDGRLTDRTGRTVDFQHTIIIATSNAHSDLIKEELEEGKGMREIAADLKKKLTAYFRPELLNRFSDIIVFKNLSRADIFAIAEIHLRDLQQQVREQSGIELIFDDAAIRAVAELGYDPVFGARPLRNVLSDKIKAVLAEKILRKEAGRGSEVAVSYDNGFTFTVQT